MASARPIYLLNGENSKDVVDLLKKLFSSQSYDKVKNIQTYSNKECTTSQCQPDKLRSFDDVVRIVKTYFPKATIKDIFLSLLQLKVKNRAGDVCNMGMGYCSDMGKIRIWYSSSPYTTNVHHSDFSYSAMLGRNQGRSSHSWAKLFEMVGIDSYEKFLEVTKKKI